MGEEHVPWPAPGRMPDAWYREVVERIGDVVCAVDRSAVIVYVNPAAEALVGERPEDLVGRSCLEFVHPDDLDRAAESLAYGAGSSRLEVPISFRLRTRTGWRSFDVRGHGLATDQRGETSLIVARESDGFDELDHLLDALTSGSSSALVHTLVARQALRPLWGNQLAIIVWREDAVREVSHTGVSAELRALLSVPGDWPWTRARRRGIVEGGVLAMLPDELADTAKRADFEAVYAVPVSDPVTSLDACIVSFGPDWLRPNLGYGYALQRCARLLRIAEHQRHQREQLELSARSDPLTGIANRRRFLHQLEDLLARAAEGPGPDVWVVYGDLDSFKPINDEHGHAAGDLVLRTIAHRLVEAASGGLAGRLGGDEFAVVGVGDPALLLDRIREQVALPIELTTGVTVSVTISLGAALAGAGDEATSLLEEADRACYLDKRERHR